MAFGSVRVKSKPTLALPQAEALAVSIVPKLREAPPGGKSHVPEVQDQLAGNPSNIATDQELQVQPGEPRSVADSGPPSMPERYLWNMQQTAQATGSGIMGLVEDSPSLKITSRTDWQSNPVEVDTLTYSAKGSPFKLTMREASSAGFVGSTFTPGYGINTVLDSETFSLTPASWGTDAMARSQRLDWTLVHLTNFGVTAFGYQNEVDGNFHVFSQLKNEFGQPGTSTTKVGGEARVGPFGFGFAQSSVDNFVQSNFENVAPITTLTAVQQEASVTLDVPHLLLAAQMSSSLFSKLLPSLWAGGSDLHNTLPGQTGPSDTMSTNFGGTWTWNIGRASLGYWDYSSAGNGSAGSAWSGRGFDGSFGVYYGSFGVDASLSYGSSEDAAPAWQSSGALYSYNVTLSYNPEKPPGIWVSAWAGNYNQNAINYDSMVSVLSSPYGVYANYTNGNYRGMQAGFDLTNWLWAPNASASVARNGQRTSFKLLYQYSDDLYLDSSTGTTRSLDNLVAVMVQHTF
jgi:hypothetical protein